VSSVVNHFVITAVNHFVISAVNHFVITVSISINSGRRVFLELSNSVYVFQLRNYSPCGLPFCEVPKDGKVKLSYLWFYFLLVPAIYIC
jgi:hypothetical protein